MTILASGGTIPSPAVIKWHTVPPWRPTLRSGDGYPSAQDQYETVQELQALLNNAGGYAISEDGLFGPATENAVRSWQALNGIHVNTIVGPATWSTLLGVRSDALPASLEPAACTTHPTLQNGSSLTGEVLDFQVLFNKHGNEIAEDGAFGSYTETAVKNWQTKEGVLADGVVGPNTWHTLCGCVSRAAGDTRSYQPILRPSEPPSILPGSCSLRPTLKQGSTDSGAVLEFQILLNRVGGYSISEDGAFGNYTKKALLAWQIKMRLDCDLIVGPPTWGTLCGPAPGAALPPRVAADCTMRPTLRSGAGTGTLVVLKDAVQEFQAMLNKAGQFSIAEDGFFGDNTERTVRDWQGKANAAVDGIVGPATWYTLAVAHV